MSYKFNPLTGTFDIGGGGSAAVTALGEKYVRTTRFASIGSLTSGTITKPTNSEIIEDDFGGTVDAVVSQITSGKPNFQPALTSSGQIITASFDTDGDWVLSGTPTAYPIAIIYRVRQELTDFDSDSTDIIGNATIEDPSVNIQIFPASGTWYKPVSATGKPAKMVKAYLLSAGGGGASGRKGLLGNGAAKCGGGGGASGALVFGEFDAATLSDTETITIGAGGTGGDGQTTNSTNGNDGVAGGDTTFGTKLIAPGGPRGRGGTATTGTGSGTSFSTASPWNFASQAGASASSTGLVGATPSNSLWINPNGGASGGGISSADVASNGAIGGAIASTITSLAVSGGAAGAAAPANASPGSSATLFFGLQVGSGGGSSRSSITGNSGNGGNGGIGAGGGGSGAVLDSTGNSGDGGDGGNGWAVVVTYF